MSSSAGAHAAGDAASQAERYGDRPLLGFGDTVVDAIATAATPRPRVAGDAARRRRRPRRPRRGDAARNRVEFLELFVRLRLDRRRGGADQHRVDGPADRLHAGQLRRAAAGDRERLRRAAGDAPTLGESALETIWVDRRATPAGTPLAILAHRRLPCRRCRRGGDAASRRRAGDRPRRHPRRSSTPPAPPARRRACSARMRSTSGGACNSADAPRRRRRRRALHDAAAVPHQRAEHLRAGAARPAAACAYEQRFSASGFWPSLVQSATPPSSTCSAPWCRSCCRSRRRRPSARIASASALGPGVPAQRRRGVPRAHRRAAARRLRLDRDQLRHRAARRTGRARTAWGWLRPGLRRPRRRCERRPNVAAGDAGELRAARRRAARVRAPAISASPRRPPKPGATAGSTPATASCATPTALSASSTGSRTRSAGAARTSRRSRSSRCCSAIRRSRAAAVYPVRSELAEDEVMAALVARPGAGARSGRADRASASRGCRTSRSRAISSSSPTCRAPRTARCRNSSCASAA